MVSMVLLRCTETLNTVARVFWVLANKEFFSFFHIFYHNNVKIPWLNYCFVCLRFVCCALLALPLIASICVAVIKRKRMREVRPGLGFAQTSNTNQYGTLLTNGSANQSKESNAAPDTTQTRDQNAENDPQSISKSKYTHKDTHSDSSCYL